MADASTIRDYSQSTGFPFYAYTTKGVVSIVRAWAEHTWPMTLQEAFTLRDQCRWIGDPQDGTFFTTPVSSGETDGTIMADTRDRNLVNSINARLTTWVHLGPRGTGGARIHHHAVHLHRLPERPDHCIRPTQRR